ncbi:MAG: helix-turn-helix domain-containing protein [Acidimicrobiales bacterium]
MAEPGQSEYLSVSDLAELLGVSEGAVRGLRYRGEGPTATKVGGRLRFPPPRRREMAGQSTRRSGGAQSPLEAVVAGRWHRHRPCADHRSGPLLLGLAHRTGSRLPVSGDGHLPRLRRRRVGHQERDTPKAPAVRPLVMVKRYARWREPPCCAG